MSFISKMYPAFTSHKKSLIVAFSAIGLLGGASTITYALSSSSTPSKPSTSLFHSNTTLAPITKKTISTTSSIPQATLPIVTTTTTTNTPTVTAAPQPVATASHTSPPKSTAPPVTSPPVTAPPVTSPPVTAPPVTSPPVTAPPTTYPTYYPPTGVAWYSIQSCPATCYVSVIYTLSNGTLSPPETEGWTEFFSGSITITRSPVTGFTLPYPVTLTYDGSTNTTTWTYPSGDPPPQP